MRNEIDFRKLADPRVCDERFMPHDETTKAGEVMEEFKALTEKDDNFIKIAESYRLQLDRFTKTTAIKPYGSTYTNVMGSYIVGQSPKDRNKLSRDALENRAIREDMYMRALTYGVNETLSKKDFHISKENDYSTLEDMHVAIELDSLGKKGPYDGGSDDIALEVCDKLCAEMKEPKLLDDKKVEWFNTALNRRFRHYEEFITKSYRYDPKAYISRIRDKGIANTYRGAPFNSSGDTTINLQQVAFAWWMLKGFIPDTWWPQLVNWKAPQRKSGLSNDEWKKIKAKANPNTQIFENWRNDRYFELLNSCFRKKIVDSKEIWVDDKDRLAPDTLTCDGLLQLILIKLEELNVDYVELVRTMKHSITSPISRDQGEPFVVALTQAGYLKIDGRSGKRKYRAVIPNSAIVQAIFIVATVELIDDAPKTASRIGLQDPYTNEVRMNDFIHDQWLKDLFIVSTDFDTYDYHLLSQLMIGNTVMYATLYDDPRLKNIFYALGFILAHKLFIMPAYVNEVGHNYNLVKNIDLPKIKGNKQIEAKRKYKFADRATKERIERELQNSWDYKAKMIYAWQSWLISGIIVTNLVGSDCTAEMGQDMLPLAMAEEVPEMKEYLSTHDLDDIKAIASGDDCANGIPRVLKEKYGYKGVLEIIERIYEYFNMIVKAKKQVKILYKGYPIVDFLQMVYPQGDDPIAMGYNKPYKKLLRQLPGGPYRERYSKHPLISQWDSIGGRFDSCLCEQNVDFAASIIYYAGRELTRMFKKSGQKPDVDASWWNNSNNPSGYDRKYAVDQNELLGLAQFLGLVKCYGKDYLAVLTKYVVDGIDEKYKDDAETRDKKVSEYIESYRIDRETRAPHRAGEERIAFSRLSARDKKLNGIESETNEDLKSYATYLPELVMSLERQFNLDIQSVELRPTVIKAETDLVDEGPSSEDVIS